MNFISVTAQQCNPQGITNQGTPPTELRINKDLIGAIRGNEILLKGGNIIALGGSHWTNFRLGNGVNVNSL